MIGDAASLVGFSVTFLVLNTLAVALRLISRRISAARLWWDDTFIVISLVGLPPVRHVSSSKCAADSVIWIIHLHLRWYDPVMQCQVLAFQRLSAVRNGMGRHAFEVTPDQELQQYKVFILDSHRHEHNAYFRQDIVRHRNLLPNSDDNYQNLDPLVLPPALRRS